MKLFVSILAILLLSSCVSKKLNWYEIETTINALKQVRPKDRAQFEFNNYPAKYFDRYPKDVIMEKLKRKYERMPTDVVYPYNDISQLQVSERHSCANFFFYTAKYEIDETIYSEYLDKESLSFVKATYGIENVSYNEVHKMMRISRPDSVVIILDKDRKWKYMDWHLETIDEYFHKDFSKCFSEKKID